MLSRGGLAARAGRPPIRVIDPAGGELITDMADETVEDGLAAVAAAERARPARAAAPPER